MRHPHWPQTRSLASNVITAFTTSLSDPLAFIYTAHGGIRVGASKTPSLAYAEAVTTERKNKSGSRLLLKYIQSSYFYIKLLAFAHHAHLFSI